jgi:eukaryotic-like serine/threonine-protein kinase
MKVAELKPLRRGTRLGKYRLDRRIGRGGFADVYVATDTLLSIKVALKIPNSRWVSDQLINEFRKEVKLTMALDHPNIMSIRDASIIDGHFVIVTPLAARTLDERLKHRMSFESAFAYATQLLDAVAYAHENGVVHCDIKPDNLLIFDDETLKLCDFGIAKAAQRTISASGTGTLGFMAPEQAMGKPSPRSDVFSIGLVIYRLFAGDWPVYPFDWPFPNAARARRKLHPDVLALLRKAILIKPKDRFADAVKMKEAWEAAAIKAKRFNGRHKST